MDHHEDSENLQIYVARLCGPQDCSDEEWSARIDGAEKLMIFSHSPSYNSQSIQSIPDKEVRDMHILNWGKSRTLLPEVSGACWTDRFVDLDE